MKSIVEATKEYLEYGKNGKRLAEKTILAYGNDMKRFLEFCEEKKGKSRANIFVEEIQGDDVREYIYTENNRRKAKTVKRRMACLRGFYTYLENQGEVDENPFCKLKFRIKDKTLLPDCLSLLEMKQILDVAYAYAPDWPASVSEPLKLFLRTRNAAILEMLFATGLRVHELCKLTYEEFDLEQGALRILGKGQKERTLYIGSESVLKSVREYLRRAEDLHMRSAYVFLNRSGEPISCQTVRMMVRHYAELAGITRRITPHTFRHTFASLLLEEGVDIKYIQEFLGHSSISTTQIYLHTSEARKRQILTDMHPRERLCVTNA